MPRRAAESGIPTGSRAFDMLYRNEAFFILIRLIKWIWPLLRAIVSTRDADLLY